MGNTDLTEKIVLGSVAAAFVSLVTLGYYTEIKGKSKKHSSSNEEWDIVPIFIVFFTLYNNSNLHISFFPHLFPYF